jgi:hypothetical protein
MSFVLSAMADPLADPQPSVPGASIQVSPSKQAKPSQIMVLADPVELEKQFVRFTPNYPLKPGSLDLFGYETQKIVRSYPVLSPEKTMMAQTEVTFLSYNKQTISRVILVPVGKPITTNNQSEQQYPTIEPAYTPQIPLAMVNPQAFWDRYLPEAQSAHRQVIVEAGFDSAKDFESEIVQVADWSEDGTKLLMIYRPGIHHLGIWRTVPVLYDSAAMSTIRLTQFPGSVWRDAKKRGLIGSTLAGHVWDIRPLGWSVEHPQDFIVKLVVFEGQSELPIGFWRYGTQSGQLLYLGDRVEADRIAHNGWVVSYIDPTAPGGPHIYGPGETPVHELPPPGSSKRSWSDRLQFWKK